MYTNDNDPLHTMANEDANVLRIDLSIPTPVYRQIVDGLRTLLVHGAFKPGDRLPTVRQVAVDLAVHHNTVAQAYRVLADEGWLELRRHSGARVIERRRQSAGADSQKNFTQRLRELAAHAVAEGLDPKSIAGQLDALSGELNR
jgi:GntR family transcriptional regulator